MNALLFLLLPSFANAASLAYDWRTSSTGATVVNILDVGTLQALEESGFSFGELLGGKRGETTAGLYESNPLYRSLADSVGEPIPHDSATDQLPAVIPNGKGDIPELVRLTRNFEDKGSRSNKDSKGGYFIHQLANNSNFPYSVESDGDEPRHFDERWLRSPFASLRLIAVVNRIDRADFHPEHCGEVRFVYRLAYRSPQSSSSLPFFLNVVKEYPKKGDCSGFAARWQIPAEKSAQLRAAGDHAPAQLAKLLANGAFSDLSLRQVEMNFQSLRFTSGYMHDFGGQAMYLQRIFQPSGGRLVPIALENTPDVLAIENDPGLLKRFVEFLKSGDHLRRLDEGTLQIDFDPHFLARLSVSWSTLGRAREANRPYARLFRENPALLKTIPMSALKFIKTPAALVERLDNLTCMGCHQAGGTAGFHMLGFADPRFSHGFNRQELPLSPHAFAEAARRTAYVAALAARALPNRFRPLSVFPEADWTGPEPKYAKSTAGQLCVAVRGAFAAAPDCETGECRATVQAPGALLGECVPKSKQIPYAGATCWEGTLEENSRVPSGHGPAPSFNFFAFQDKWHLKGAVHPDSGAYKCVLPQSGAPLGRSSRVCTVEEENFPALGAANPAELCANQGGNGFDLCAASGNSGACLESRVVRAMLDTCYPGHFCREDYICQRFPDYQNISEADYGKRKAGKRVNQSSPAKIHGENIAAAHDRNLGFCVPTYFLFNMRLDGHPNPVTGKAPGMPVMNRSLPVRGYK